MTYGEAWEKHEHDYALRMLPRGAKPSEVAGNLHRSLSDVLSYIKNIIEPGLDWTPPPVKDRRTALEKTNEAFVARLHECALKQARPFKIYAPDMALLLVLHPNRISRKVAA